MCESHKVAFSVNKGHSMRFAEIERDVALQHSVRKYLIGHRGNIVPSRHQRRGPAYGMSTIEASLPGPARRRHSLVAATKIK